ncbi:putative serine hydroxymethyltransferase [Plasmodium gaboni]|uniref:Putative serine hydroxymethyltransferase n=1 Tax=Plasmodium gaboni TaxID=647221 RepID=A0A151LB23_9APIC|nr:putative serine hydroxymethyltransferase [Plasmodium gaboni]KYN96152.1 putative serine hydroxymethyltransferase [Plasmodium gaboni]
MLKEFVKNVSAKNHRYISYYSLRNHSRLKDIDDETYNILNSYKNKNDINLSVVNNIMPTYMKEYLSLDLNPNIFVNNKDIEMLEYIALNSFNLEKKYWGCLISTTSLNNNNNKSIDDYFFNKLYGHFLKKECKILRISFCLEQNIENNISSDIMQNIYNVVNIKNINEPNYNEMQKISNDFNPDIIYIDESNNPYNIDYDKFIKGIKNKNNKIHNKPIIITNMNNKASLISQNFINSPFDHSDIVFTYFNENFRAHNSFVIFYKKGYKCVNTDGHIIEYDYEKKLKHTFGDAYLNNIFFSFFTSFKLMKNEEFKEYVKQTKENTYALYKYINRKYFYLQYSQNNNFFNLNPSNCTFNIQEFYLLCNKLNIYFDILKDKSSNQKSFNIGSNYLTTLGLLTHDIKNVAEFFNESVVLYFYLKEKSKLSNMSFIQYIENNSSASDIFSLAVDISSFISSYPSPYTNEAK